MIYAFLAAVAAYALPALWTYARREWEDKL